MEIARNEYFDNLTVAAWAQLLIGRAREIDVITGESLRGHPDLFGSLCDEIALRGEDETARRFVDAMFLIVQRASIETGIPENAALWEQDLNLLCDMVELAARIPMTVLRLASDIDHKIDVLYDNYIRPDSLSVPEATQPRIRHATMRLLTRLNYPIPEAVARQRLADPSSSRDA